MMTYPKKGVCETIQHRAWCRFQPYRTALNIQRSLRSNPGPCPSWAGWRWGGTLQVWISSLLRREKENHHTFRIFAQSQTPQLQFDPMFFHWPFGFVCLAKKLGIWFQRLQINTAKGCTKYTLRSYWTVEIREIQPYIRFKKKINFWLIENNY